MNKRELTIEEIRDIAFRTNGRSDNSIWMAQRYGKLTSSKFGRAISVIRNANSTNIQHLRNGIYAPTNVDQVAGIKCGLDPESLATDANLNTTGSIVKLTRLWMFRNIIMGASPEGLFLPDPHRACAFGILEVKCHSSMREVKIDCSSEWHNHLTYLDCSNMRKKRHDYNHQRQGPMAAVGVCWCYFVIWPRSKIKSQRIRRYYGWSIRYVPQFESVYNHQINCTEDFDEGFSDRARRDTEEENVKPYDHRARDLTSILHQICAVAQYLRHMVTQSNVIYQNIVCLFLRIKSA